MTPKELVDNWVDKFNEAITVEIAAPYPVLLLIISLPISGEKNSIRKVFAAEFVNFFI